MSAKDADRLSALHEQSLVVAKISELYDDRVVAFPIARCLARAAVHHQVFRTLGNIGIEIVHQHPECGFLLPAPAGNGRAARSADRLALLFDAERIGIEPYSQIGHVALPMSANRISETAVASAAMSVLRTRSFSSRGTIARTRS